jgi:predicted nuclease of predicted toxin-antitoxin system
VRVKLDENLPDSVLSLLGGVGHDVDTARAEGRRGAKDPAVLAGATADGRLLLTLDRGLGDIRGYPPGTHAGIVVVRLDHHSPRAIRDAVERISVTVDLADLQGCVAVWRRRASRPSPLTIVTTPRTSRTMRASGDDWENARSRLWAVRQRSRRSVRISRIWFSACGPTLPIG